MKLFNANEYIATIAALVAALLLIAAFLIETGFLFSPFVMFGVALFLLTPQRASSAFARRLITLLSIIFAIWVLKEIRSLLTPFIIALVSAYILEPVVVFFEKKRIPRTVTAMGVVLLVTGGVTAVSVFVFPTIFSQLNLVITKLTVEVNNLIQFLESREFFRSLAKFGLPVKTSKHIITTEFIPRLESGIELVYEGLLVSLTNIANILTQIINVILVPIFSFYFLRDFNKIKGLIQGALEGSNDKLLKDLRRINNILQAYIGGQIIAAIMVSICSTIAYISFGIPYPIVLGLITGLLNPIPYIGIFSNIIIGGITVIIVGDGDWLTQLIIIAIIINVLHFLDMYVLQPRIVGKRIGLHPLLLILSLVTFGYFFGIIGLLCAVPTTAVLVMFFNDWYEKQKIKKQPIYSPDSALKAGGGGAVAIATTGGMVQDDVRDDSQNDNK